MANKNIFCNTPWYELHVYWDGSLGICCQEDHKLYQDANYNVANTSLLTWFNSDPVTNFRQALLRDKQHSACRRCYIDEQAQGNSRRLKSNQKSVIFTRQAFEPSYQQSPGLPHFEHSLNNRGLTTSAPIDVHIDLGNFCNLACKMCKPRASSKIASQHVLWGIETSRQYLGVDWTKDSQVWQSFLDQLLAIPGLKNIHFMGGETLLTPRLEQLVDRFTAEKRFEVCFSFVTNGTVYNQRLIEKLCKFSRVGIEVSIETLTAHNAYQRQGTDTDLVLENIDKYLENCNDDNITVALRPAPSLLTVGHYISLLQFAQQRRLIVKSNLCFDPEFLYPAVLPTDVKQLYLSRYNAFLNQLSDVDTGSDYNASDPVSYTHLTLPTKA